MTISLRVTDDLVLAAPFDAHLHLREGEMLRAVAPWTDRCCSRALVMPNLVPPVDNVARLTAYAQEVREALAFTEPLFTFKVTRGLRPGDLATLKELGCVAGKLYPEGVTTNSSDGVNADDLRNPHPWLVDLYGEMERLGLVLCVHGEMPGSFCLDREDDCHDAVLGILQSFPRLKVVLEHITTRASCDLVQFGDFDGRLGATVTAHHLFLTLDDVVGNELRPHHFCKPVAKRPEDREALRRLARSGLPNVFLGSDSAPHPRKKKEGDCGCAGVFSAPVLVEKLAEAFEGMGALDRLEAFWCRNAEAFYGLPPTGKTVQLHRLGAAPTVVGGVVPWCAGERLEWHLRAAVAAR